MAKEWSTVGCAYNCLFRNNEAALDTQRTIQVRATHFRIDMTQCILGLWTDPR